MPKLHRLTHNYKVVIDINGITTGFFLLHERLEIVLDNFKKKSPMCGPLMSRLHRTYTR